MQVNDMSDQTTAQAMCEAARAVASLVAQAQRMKGLIEDMKRQ